MRAFTAGVTAAILSIGLVAPSVAQAADAPGALVFSPGLAGPGDVVTALTSACGEAASAIVYPKTVGAPVVLGPSLEPGRAKGVFRVWSSAEPGTYTIPGVCADGRHIAGILKVPHSWIG